jgi:hypothetical protein
MAAFQQLHSAIHIKLFLSLFEPLDNPLKATLLGLFGSVAFSWFRRRRVRLVMSGRWCKERPEMTAHAGVASHKAEKEQGGKLFRQCFGSRDVDFGAAAIRAIL